MSADWGRHAIEWQRCTTRADALHVTSHYGGITQSALITRRDLEAAATELARPDARAIHIIRGIGLDESEVLSLLAELGDPT